MKKAVMHVLSFLLCLVMLGLLIPVPQALASEIISSLDITVIAPKTGEHPSSWFSCSTYGILEDSYIYWAQLEPTTNYLFNSSDEFVEDGVYEVNIVLWIDPFYLSEINFASDMQVRVNGQVVTTVEKNTDSECEWMGSYTFPALKGGNEEPNDAVSVTITPPEAGMKPDYAPYVSSSANYQVKNSTSGNQKNGVTWKDVTDASNSFFLDPSVDKFISGHTYSVIINLVPKDGYSIPKGTPGYLNDNQANGNWYPGIACYQLTYTFPALVGSSWVKKDGDWYFYKDGTTVTGWYKDGTKWYYFNSSGVMQSGWIQLGGKWYYLGNEMKTGWQKISNKWYYFNSDGVMQSGWIQLGGKWYYLGNEMKTGWQKISNKWYYFNSNGVMQSGWIQLGGKWYYLGNEMKTGWQNISNKWYYFNSDGVMQTGWIQLGGKWYYLGNEMKTGWQKISNKWYYFDSNGVMQSGWQKIGGKWYYLDNGAMVTGTRVIDGKTYTFYSNGVWQQ